MLSFPNAKINIGLNVINRRKDGYHNLETVFFPVPLCDALELVETGETLLQIFGMQIDGNIENNLIIKALRILQKDFDIPQISCFLKKNIPMGAGLGGGSADAAFMLKMLNKYFMLNISIEDLEKYAAKLGADCPFFIRNKPAFAEETGNVMTEINIPLQGYYLLLIKPNIHISTAEAYKTLSPEKWETPLAEAIKQPLENWKNCIFNDFEKPVFMQHPALAQIKNKIYELGAQYAAMSGSGSIVYGIFSEKPNIEIFGNSAIFCEKISGIGKFA
jgi:4-diphosphocytidyl-2-C-methyl-D-erythritol kinase